MSRSNVLILIYFPLYCLNLQKYVLLVSQDPIALSPFVLCIQPAYFFQTYLSSIYNAS